MAAAVPGAVVGEQQQRHVVVEHAIPAGLYGVDQGLEVRRP